MTRITPAEVREIVESLGIVIAYKEPYAILLRLATQMEADEERMKGRVSVPIEDLQNAITATRDYAQQVAWPHSGYDPGVKWFALADRFAATLEGEK